MSKSAAELPSAQRLRWQCRRGMLELDTLFEQYLDSRYAEAPESTKSTFIRLLEFPDPLIMAWVMGDETPADDALMDLVLELRQLNS